MLVIGYNKCSAQSGHSISSWTYLSKLVQLVTRRGGVASSAAEDSECWRMRLTTSGHCTWFDYHQSCGLTPRRARWPAYRTTDGLQESTGAIASVESRSSLRRRETLRRVGRRQSAIVRFGVSRGAARRAAGRPTTYLNAAAEKTSEMRLGWDPDGRPLACLLSGRTSAGRRAC